MANLDVPRPRSSYIRDISPSGQSEVSDSSIDDSPDTTLAYAKEKRTSRGLSNILLPACLRPRRKRMTEKAFDQWQAKERRPLVNLLVLLILAAVLIVILTALLAYSIIHLHRLIPKNDIQRIVASWGKPDTVTGSLAEYPTRFSQGINPIPCHSHNDYTRKVPLYEALSAGCTGVEADVWYSPRDLLVGHTISSLTEERTLKSMYIDPLISILSHQNPSSKPLTESNTTLPLHGLWDSSPALPLILLVDVKNDPEDIFKALQDALDPLRSRGWLTSFDGGKIIQRLITVVATGEAPFDLISKNSTYRDIFYDAPLADLWGEDAPRNNGRYDSTNSYYASTNFEASVGKLWHGTLSPKQVDVIRGQVAEAQRRGLKVRYWNTPSWPRSSKEHVWDVLEKEGVDMLNADDLIGVTQRKW